MSDQPTAAAVLAVGRLLQSPRLNTLGNLSCCSVCLSTDTKPASLARGLDLSTDGADMGGVACRKSY